MYNSNIFFGIYEVRNSPHESGDLSWPFACIRAKKIAYQPERGESVDAKLGISPKSNRVESKPSQKQAGNAKGKRPKTIARFQ